MRNILKKYDKVEEVLLVCSLVFNVMLIFLQIVMRSVFNTSISWSEELSRYIFIWQIWLGISIAYKENQHIKVELIFNIFKSQTIHKIINIIVDIIWILFNGFLTYQGILLIISMNSRNALSSGMRLPLIYVYVVLPISSFILCVRIILDLIDKMTGRYDYEVATKSEEA